MNMKKGFTLIELLVVMAILVSLAGVVLVSVTITINKAAWVRAEKEAEQIATAAILYFQENGEMPPDSGGPDEEDFEAPFYAQYIAGISPFEEPRSYLGSEYYWDWESWGRSASGNGWLHTQPTPSMCWQSIDLWSQNGLALRKCVRNTCVNQLYCDENGYCYNSAQDRDNNISGDNDLGHYWDIPASAICEDCVGKEECARKFIPRCYGCSS